MSFIQMAMPVLKQLGCLLVARDSVHACDVLKQARTLSGLATSLSVGVIAAADCETSDSKIASGLMKNQKRRLPKKGSTKKKKHNGSQCS